MLTKSNYNVQILVDGKPAKEYTKNGKTFVESKTGTEYSVRIKNNSGKRAVAIVSIDGINTITGEIAKPDSTGYVVQAFSSIEVKGYRQDDETGGRFKFTEKESGYSKEIDGTGVNSGVIGVLFYQEKEPPAIIRIGKLIPDPEPFDNWPWDESRPWRPYKPHRPYFGDPIWKTTCGGTAAASAEPVRLFNSALRGTPTGDRDRGVSYSNHTQSLGNGVEAMSFCSSVEQPTPEFDAATTWGSKFSESLEYVDFVRDNVSAETYNLYYASRSALKAMGVIKESTPQITFPQSFTGFAKPPSNWKS